MENSGTSCLQRIALVISSVALGASAVAQTAPAPAPGGPAAPRAASVPAAPAAAPVAAAPATAGCSDPDFLQAGHDLDVLSNELQAFKAPDLSGDRADYIKRFAGGDETKGDQMLQRYVSYYGGAFNQTVLAGQTQLRRILMQGRIAESPFKTATGLADAYDHLMADNLNLMAAASHKYDAARQAAPLDERNAGAAFGLKAVFSQIVKLNNENHYGDVWKKFLFQLCGKVSVDAKFGDSNLRVVGCGPFNPPGGWAPAGADPASAEAGLCHISLNCSAAYQQTPAGDPNKNGYAFLPNTHYFSASCPRNLCTDMKACLEAEAAKGGVPVQSLAPTKAVQ